MSKKVSGNRDHYKSTEKTSKNESAERWSRDYGTVRKELKNSGSLKENKTYIVKLRFWILICLM